MVARRAHNPEVVRFKSHPRNQKATDAQRRPLLFSCGERSYPRPTEEVVGLETERSRCEEERGRQGRKQGVSRAALAANRYDYVFEWAMKVPPPQPKRFHSRLGFGYGILLYIQKIAHFRPFTAHFGGFEGIFSYKTDKSAILCPTKTETADFVSFKGSIVQGMDLIDKLEFDSYLTALMVYVAPQ